MAAALSGSPKLVAAQVSVVGTWRVSETNVDVTVETWAAECGARPTSTRAKGGGVVTIEQKDQTLLLHGRDQDIRSDACWSRNPAIKRSLASYANGQWTTRCRTPEHEPLAEQGTYTLRLQDPNTLFYKDISHYDWTLPEVKCVATYTTSQTFTRVDSRIDSNDVTNVPARGTKATNEVASPASGSTRGNRAATTSTSTAPATSAAAATTPAPATTPTSTTASSACVPGTATRLLIRPRHAELEPGQRICFRTRLLDADDCPVPASDVIWQLAHASGLRATLNGSCFSAAEGADAEGEFRVLAKRGSLQAEVNVNVRRVDLSSLTARRSEERAADDEDNDDGFVAPKPATQIATRVAAPAEQGTRIRLALGVGLGTCAVLLLALGLWIRNHPRLRNAAALAAAADEPIAAAPSAREPSKRIETSGSTSEKPETDDTSTQQWICPTCRVGYPAQQTTCPKDGSTLLSYATFTERSKRVEQEHAKRCPTCGKTYPQSASFCGDDGVALVSVQ